MVIVIFCVDDARCYRVLLRQELKAAIEAVLFTRAEPIDIEELSEPWEFQCRIPGDTARTNFGV